MPLLYRVRRYSKADKDQTIAATIGNFRDDQEGNEYRGKGTVLQTNCIWAEEYEGTKGCGINDVVKNVADRITRLGIQNEK